MSIQTNEIKNKLAMGLFFGFILGGIMILLGSNISLPTHNGNYFFGSIFWILNYFCSVPILIGWHTIGIFAAGHEMWLGLIVLVYFMILGVLFSWLLECDKKAAMGTFFVWIFVHSACLYIFLHH